MTPFSYLSIFRRRWKIVLLTCLIGVAAGWLTTPSKSDRSVVGATFNATSTLALEVDAVAEDPPMTLAEMAARTTAGQVPRRVAAKLSIDDPVALARRIDTRTDDDAGTLAISVSDRSASRASLLANTFAEELVAALNERARAQHEVEITATTQQLAKLKGQIEDVSARLGTTRNDVLTAERDALVGRYAFAYNQSQDFLERPAPTAGIAVLETATPIREEATGISVPRNSAGRAAITGAVGLALGLGLALLAERVDTRLRSKSQVELAFGLPVIAEIPRRRRRTRPALSATDPESLYAESFRQLRTSILANANLLTASRAVAVAEPATPHALAPLASAHEIRGEHPGRLGVEPGQSAVDPSDGGLVKTFEPRYRHPSAASANGQAPRPLRTLLVTSAVAGEGKTTVAANLAAVFAENASRVLVLDCDFRRPSIARALPMPHAPGDRSGSGAGDSASALAGRLRNTSVPGVRIVELGTAGKAGEALTTALELLAQAREQADVVIVDTAPLLVASVAGALVADVDGVAVVARSGTTTGPTATDAGQRLARLEAPVLGVALLNASPNRSARRYYRSGRRRRSRALSTTVEVTSTSDATIETPVDDPEAVGPVQQAEGDTPEHRDQADPEPARVQSEIQPSEPAEEVEAAAPAADAGTVASPDSSLSGKGQRRSRKRVTTSSSEPADAAAAPVRRRRQVPIPGSSGTVSASAATGASDIASVPETSSTGVEVESADITTGVIPDKAEVPDSASESPAETPSDTEAPLTSVVAPRTIRRPKTTP